MDKININKRLRQILERISKLKNDKDENLYLYAEWGFIEFSLGVSGIFRTSNKFSVGLNAMVRIITIERFWDDMAALLGFETNLHTSEYKNSQLKAKDGIPTFSFGPNNYFSSTSEMNSKIPMFEDTNNGFESIENIFTEVFMEKLTPSLQQVLDIKYLDSTINNKVEYIGGDTSDYLLNLQGILLRRMILAKLSGNILYEDISSFNRGIIKRLNDIEIKNSYQENFPIVFEKVYERLHDIMPLSECKLNL